MGGGRRESALDFSAPSTHIYNAYIDEIEEGRVKEGGREKQRGEREEDRQRRESALGFSPPSTLIYNAHINGMGKGRVKEGGRGKQRDR